MTSEEKNAVGVIARDSSTTGDVPVTQQSVAARQAGGETVSKLLFETSADAPACHECGSIMVRSAACYKCMNCGATSGCS